MPRVDLGAEALHALRERLNVGVGRSVDKAVHWWFWGTRQRAWSAPALRNGDRTVWRLHLRTRLLEGYQGGFTQRAALSTAMLPASLAGVVWSQDPSDQLELASALDVHEGNCEWAVKLLVTVARAQAAEARHLLSSADTLASVGMTPLIDATATFPAGVMNSSEVLFRDTQAASPGYRWFADEIAMCADSLRQAGQAHVVRTPWGVSATITQHGATEARSILEVRRDAGRPLLGRGLSLTLWAPLRGGPIDALQWNHRELGATNLNCALGGWWAPEGGFLMHSCFIPEAFCGIDQLGHWLQVCTRRAHHVNATVAEKTSPHH